MLIRLLGTAAGGGFPQWNCSCSNCRGLRTGKLRGKPRTQSSVALSAEGASWFLLNASPDVRTQVESFAPLGPPAGKTRGTSLEGILLSNADLDHTLGLLVLREGPPLPIHASAMTRRALDEGLRLSSVLDSYAGAPWREPSEQWAPLLSQDGTPSGLSYAFLPLPGKSPRYRSTTPQIERGESVAMRIRDETTGGVLVYAPGVAVLEEALLSIMEEADLLLLDGTFFREDELRLSHVGSWTAREMGHVPIGGSTGTLAQIRDLPARNKAYVHINNTNPMLDEASPEHAEVGRAGIRVGWDGMEFRI